MISHPHLQKVLTMKVLAFSIKFCLLCVFVFGLGACTDSSRESSDPVITPSGGDTSSTTIDDGGENEEFSTAEMLTNIADAIIIPTYEELVTQTELLASSEGDLSDYCSAIGTSEESSKEALAKDSWKASMAVVQGSEMLAIGPATDNGSSFRKKILSYSEGSLNSCGVDEMAVLAGRAELDVSERATNQRGLGGIEYLLFNESLDHTCPPQAATTSNWNALDDTTRRKNRCNAALAIAEDVAAAAVQLRDAWLETGGDFRSEYISESNVGNSLQMTTDAIFYVDTGVKDKKLGIPLGINDACSAFSCPGSVESPYSESSFANIKNNVETFLEVFQGASGVGFDDFISEEGYPEVSERIITNSEAVIAALEGVSTSVIDQVNSISDSEDESQCNNAFANPDNLDSLSACSIYGLIKRITDDLKIDFVTIVNVNLPSGAQSDND